VFGPLLDVLLTRDFYMHLADLSSYLNADAQLESLYLRPEAWAQKTIRNVASSGKFSSDRTISEYASGIWNVEPCPVP
jgi:starch phosphorylase